MVPKYDLSSLSGLMCAAAPISPHVFQLLLDRIASPRPFSIRQGGSVPLFGHTTFYINNPLMERTILFKLDTLSFT